jgi:hypothetical protein
MRRGVVSTGWGESKLVDSSLWQSIRRLQTRQKQNGTGEMQLLDGTKRHIGDSRTRTRAHITIVIHSSVRSPWLLAVAGVGLCDSMLGASFPETLSLSPVKSITGPYQDKVDQPNMLNVRQYAESGLRR